MAEQKRIPSMDAVGRSASPAVAMAWSFLRGGYKIIPIVPATKRPLNAGGCNEPIRSWMAFKPFVDRWPNLNYGILTGSTNNLIVVDVDSEEGWRAFQNACRAAGGLSPTVAVQTGRGWHLYYSAGNATVHNMVGVLPGVDIRGNGGYVVGPGSVHESGRSYSFVDGLSFDSLRPAVLPAFLATFTKPKMAGASPPPAGSSVIVEGQRNRSLTTLAGTLLNSGLDRDGILAAITVENENKCRPPLGQKEVDQIAESVSRYDVHAPAGDEAQSIAEAVLAKEFNGGSHLIIASDGQFWHFDITHWKVLPKNLLRRRTLQVLDEMPPRKRANKAALLAQVDTLLAARCAVDGDPLRFTGEPPFAINCLNCELWFNWTTGRFEPRAHDYKSYFRYRLETNYDPSAQCPYYDRALWQIFSECSEPEVMAGFWNRLMGYAIQPRRPCPVIVIGFGDGSNGKSSLVQFFVRLIGQERVAAMPIGDIDKSQFAIGSLDGKLLLVDDDVKAGQRLPDGSLKKLSEEKIINGEHKFGPSFSFTVRTLPIILCNNSPSTADLSYGLRRRLYVVPFNHTFSEAEADASIFSRIAATEMPGVLNRLLFGLCEVVRAGWRLKRPATIVKATEDFIFGANPLPQFLEMECERTGSIMLTRLFEIYQDWCESSGITYRQQRNNVKKNLENLGFNVRHVKIGDLVEGLSCKTRRSIAH